MAGGLEQRGRDVAERIDGLLGDLFVLSNHVAHRSVSEDAALATAREMVGEDLSVAELENAFRVLGVNARVERDPDVTYHFARLTLALAEGKWGQDRGSPWWLAADMFVEITRRTLYVKPWGSRLMEAVRTAELQVSLLRRRIRRLRVRGGFLTVNGRAEIQAERAEVAETMRVIGWLVAGPYCNAIDPDDVPDSLTRWLAPFDPLGQGIVQYGQDGAPVMKGLLFREKGQAMPEPQLALAAALGYLKTALRYASSEERGRCQMARAQVLSLLARLGPERANKYWATATDAVQEILTTVDPTSCLDEFFRAVAPVARQLQVEPEALAALLPIPPEELRSRIPDGELVWLLSDVAVFLEDSGDLRRIWEVVQAVLTDDGPLPIPPQVWTNLAHRLPDSRLRCPRTPVDYTTLIATAEKWCDDMNASPRERAATLTHAALHVRREDVGKSIGLLETIHEVDEGFRNNYAWILDYLLLKHRKRYATALEQSGRHHEALLEYVCAAEIAAKFARRHLSPGLLTELVRLALNAFVQQGTVENLGQDDDHMFLQLMMLFLVAEPTVTSMVAVVDERVDFVYGLGQLLACALERAASKNSHSKIATLFSWHHIMFKGYAFRLFAQSPRPRPLTPYVKHLNELIHVQETKNGPHVPDRPKFLDDALSLPDGIAGLLFVSSREKAPGGDGLPTVGNLRRSADHAINASLVIHGVDKRVGDNLHRLGMFEMELEQVSRDLDDDTVLISLYLASYDDSRATADPRASLIACHITRQGETVRVVRLDLPGATFRLFAGSDTSYSLHWAALRVAEVREEVNSDPLGARVSLRGAEALEHNYFLLGGPPPDQLRAWQAAGKRHLVFWPHGPLHYVPFHLLHVDRKPLADDWTITTIASSAQLLLRPLQPRRKRRLLVLGVSSADPRFGLPEQPQVTEHARYLAARVPGARILQPDEATPRAVMAAMRDTDYLHIAAHGSLDVEAPWYQCLYLSPDGGENDGRLFAHQILDLDLRGIDLVTLSACESALGRYDLNDNLRGLPAAFMLAGVATVVGALWPVTAPVATLFFDELYTQLLAGASKRGAFRRAQLATRDAQPAYRDWGAFTLIGDWR